MNPQTFFEHFERLTNAPNAVTRLRELILQLAVQGKLVEQDERDEPAARLLERIEAKRKRLVREKKIKEAKPLPPVSNDEKPFEIPDSWQWVRLGHVADSCLGKMLDKHKNKGKPLPYLRNVNVRWFDFDLSDVLEMRFEDDELERFGLQSGDVLICEGGEPGRAAIWDGRVPGMKFQKALHRVRPSAALYNRFLVYLLFIDAKTKKLDEHFTGATIKHFTGQELARYLIALPPSEEQKRIVAKVDELMRLCDELERAQAERREARQSLNRAALDGLLAARDAAEFQARWQTITDNFPILSAAPDQIGKLRQTVLQLAVQGKLTRQDPGDESAPTLLQRIRAERERLVKEKKLKRADPLPPINPDETPFALPNGWTWVRLNELLTFMDAGWSPNCNDNPTKDEQTWGVLKTTAVQTMRYLQEEHKELPSDLKPRSEYEVVAGDILITRAGPKHRVGISCLIKKTRPRLMISDKIIRFHLFDSLTLPEFFVLCLSTGFSKAFVESQKSGMAVSQMNISQPKLRLTPLPMPPLEEQKRIVAAVNGLMALCDELEAGLRRVEEDGERLLRAAVRSLLSPAPENSMRMPALA